MSYSVAKVPIGEGYDAENLDGLTVGFDTIDEALEELNAAPELYEGIRNLYGNVIDLYKIGANLKPDLDNPEDGCFWYCLKYDTGLGDGSDAFEDEYTEGVLATFEGEDMSSSVKRIGRGEGLYDVAGLKICGHADPCDVIQGNIGNCWLMSSFSAVAEFDGVIQKNFETDDINEEGRYRIKLFDLPSQEWVTYEIDDRLFMDGLIPRFGRGSADAEMWAPLLEKAYAIHAGGWDNIGEGGDSTIGLACITGCTQTFSIQNNRRSIDGYESYTFTPWVWDWEGLPNCQSDDSYKLLRKAFGEIEGFDEPIDADTLFDFLCEWDDKGYIMCAGSARPGAEGDHDVANQGIADSHEYALIAAKKYVCGKFDLVCFRNPWGSGEFSGGNGTAGWHDGGDMWEEYPEAYDELDYAPDPDDGLFWMEFKDAVNYFWNFNVCMADTSGRREPTSISNGKRSAREALNKKK